MLFLAILATHIASGLYKRGDGTLGAFFRFSERGTNFRTEVLAGLTTFMTMAYIIFVNPAILGTEGTGLPVTGVFFATCVAAAVACIAMGLVANYPLALASGLGLNAIVAFTLILGLGLSWQEAMAVVVVEGVLVTMLVLTNLREAVLDAIPNSLKFAIAVGIGLFIAFIGLKNAGLVVQDPATYLKLGDLTQGPVLLAAFGLVVTLALVARGVRGGILIGIVVTGIVGMIAGIVPPPPRVGDLRPPAPPPRAAARVGAGRCGGGVCRVGRVGGGRGARMAGLGPRRGGMVAFRFDTSTIGGGV